MTHFSKSIGIEFKNSVQYQSKEKIIAHYDYQNGGKVVRRIQICFQRSIL